MLSLATGIVCCVVNARMCLLFAKVKTEVKITIVAKQINAPNMIEVLFENSLILFLAAQYSLVIELFLYLSNSQCGKLGSSALVIIYKSYFSPSVYSELSSYSIPLLISSFLFSSRFFSKTSTLEVAGFAIPRYIKKPPISNPTTKINIANTVIPFSVF